MLALGSLAVASPGLLVALAALPIIWWLLRVTPPAPRRIAFPSIRLLLGLVPREETPARNPFWLILLRMTLSPLVILAVAHPLLNPQAHLASSGPIIFVVDDGWAAARDWPARQAALNDLLARADREGRQVVLVTTAPTAADEPPAPGATLSSRPLGQLAGGLPSPGSKRCLCRRQVPPFGSAMGSPMAARMTSSPPIYRSEAACATSLHRQPRRL